MYKRQRLRPSIEESTQIVCPRCHGVGVIRGAESLGLSILRLLEEEAIKENTRRVTVQLPVDVATFLLNEKRNQITKVEDRHKLHILIVPNEHLETPQYIMERTRIGEETSHGASYEVKELIVPELEQEMEQQKQQVQKEEPAVKNIQPTSPPPPSNAQKEQAAKPGLFARVWKALFSKEEEPQEEEKPKNHGNRNRRRNNDGRNDNRNRNRNRRNRNRRDDDDNNRNRNRRRPNERAEETNDESQQTSEKSSRNRNRRRRENRRDNEAASAAQTDETLNKSNQVEETSTTEEQTADKGKERSKEERGGRRRRSRYNTRSYNSRRRAPHDAENMSIDSPAPGSEKASETEAGKENKSAQTVENVTQTTVETAVETKVEPKQEVQQEIQTEAKAEAPAETSAETLSLIHI